MENVALTHAAPSTLDAVARSIGFPSAAALANELETLAGDDDATIMIECASTGETVTVPRALLLDVFDVLEREVSR